MVRVKRILTIGCVALSLWLLCSFVDTISHNLDGVGYAPWNVIVNTYKVGIRARARARMTKAQKRRAKTMQKICIKYWDDYGVLPSTCIVQAFVESTLGEFPCASYNYWGIASGGESYGSLEEGALRYLRVINNGYYSDAPFKTDTRQQLRAILDGGYCEPVGNYYRDASWLIDKYDLEEYDKPIFEMLKERRRQAKLKHKFKLVYDESLDWEELRVDFNIIKRDETVDIQIDHVSKVLTDKLKPGGKKYVIYTGDARLDGMKAKVIETKAKG